MAAPEFEQIGTEIDRLIARARTSPPRLRGRIEDEVMRLVEPLVQQGAKGAIAKLSARVWFSAGREDILQDARLAVAKTISRLIDQPGEPTAAHTTAALVETVARRRALDAVARSGALGKSRSAQRHASARAAAETVERSATSPVARAEVATWAGVASPDAQRLAHQAAEQRQRQHQQRDTHAPTRRVHVEDLALVAPVVGGPEAALLADEAKREAQQQLAARLGVAVEQIDRVIEAYETGDPKERRRLLADLRRRAAAVAAGRDPDEHDDRRRLRDAARRAVEVAGLDPEQGRALVGRFTRARDEAARRVAEGDLRRACGLPLRGSLPEVVEQRKAEIGDLTAALAFAGMPEASARSEAQTAFRTADATERSRRVARLAHRAGVPDGVAVSTWVAMQAQHEAEAARRFAQLDEEMRRARELSEAGASQLTLV